MSTGMPEPQQFDSLNAHEQKLLSRVLEALDAYTTAPVRLRGHSTDGVCTVFELQEEFELGDPGRRFLMSIADAGQSAVLIPVHSNVLEMQ